MRRRGGAKAAAPDGAAIGAPANGENLPSSELVEAPDLWWDVGVVALVLVRVSAALTLMISDCDETFNYWEPTHYVCADPCRNPYDSTQRMVGFNGRA